MNTTRILTGLLLATMAAQADIILTPTWDSGDGLANGGVIPDGNLTGWSDTRTISGYSGYTISDLNVLLELSGGYNGDLYGYLVHGSGFAVLLNRMGVGVTGPLSAFGSDAPGMDVTFDDGAASGDIHSYTGSAVLTGLWQADGRDLSPLSSALALENATRQNGGSPLGVFHGLNPDGNWTLFLADVSGGAQATVQEWGMVMTLTAVPEPAPWLAGAVVFAVAGLYALRVRRQAPRAPIARRLAPYAEAPAGEV
jgi:hypothetical protein